MLIRASLLALFALASPTLAEEIACEGAFAIDSSEARLIELYGADNVVTGIVPGPEGSEMLATRVFPDQPRKEIQFVWWNEQDRSDPSYIELPSKLTAPGGVAIGTTLEELEALNGGSFTFSGFGWDYGGAASFERGALADLPGGCILSVYLFPHAASDAADTRSIEGDITVKSTNPLLDTMDVRVGMVLVGYPHPDLR